MRLSELKEEFKKYIVMSDDTILDIIFATLVGNLLIDQDPLWLMVVAPSSAGKTTLIAPCAGIRAVTFVDDLTEKTLLSGYKIKGKDMSLLKKIGSGIMAFSDFTSILSKNPVSRGEILAQLKLVYDRKVSKYTGTGGVEWEGKIGMLAAATPDIYSFMEGGRAMGERFVYYWLEQADNEAIMQKQSEVHLSSKEINDRMKDWYDNYFVELSQDKEKEIIKLTLTPEQTARIHSAALFCVNGKATIKTDFKTNKPIAIPNVAGVGRDIKIFNTILMGLVFMRRHDTEEVNVTDRMLHIIEKCAYSSINRERRKIMEILVNEKGGTLTASTIGAQRGLGLEKDAVELYLRPLHAVGLVKKSKKGGAFSWYIKDKWQIDFIQRVSKKTQELVQAQAIEEEKEESMSDWLVQMENQQYNTKNEGEELA